MAKLILTLSDLYTHVSNFLGLTATGTAPTGTDLTTCKDICYRGYRQFLYPISAITGELHNWSFLKQLHVFNVQSGKWKYSLPDNFSDVLEPPYFDDSKGYNELTRIGPEQILKLRTSGISSGFPTYFALAPYTFDDSTGTFYEMWIDPEPDGTYLLKMFYRIDPLKPEDAADYLIGGVRATETIIENCLAVAEQQEDDTIGIHTKLANELTQKLIKSDIQEESDVLGNLTDPKPTNYRWYSAVNTDEVYEAEGGLG